MTVPPSRGVSTHPEGLSSLVERVDLYELVARYAGPGRSSGRTTSYSCPHPAHPDHSPSFTVSTTSTGKQLARCWSQCAWQGDALELVKWLENLSTSEGAKWLRDYLGLKVAPARSLESRPATPSKLHRSLSPKPVDTATRPADTEAASRFLARYLDHRGWPSEVATTFGLEVVLDSSGSGRIRHSYFTPTASGEWVATYWQDRGVGSSHPKWLSPKGGSPALYNLRSLETENLAAVVICEGPADTITATLALEGAERVAVVGCPGVSAWRSEWSPLFEGLRVVVAADNDAAGRTLEQAVSSSLRRQVTYLRPSHGDLTDTAKARGLGSLRELLITALSLEPDTQERPLEDTLKLLLEVFPGGFLEVGAA